jgi:hypothetical protein
MINAVKQLKVIPLNSETLGLIKDQISAIKQITIANMVLTYLQVSANLNPFVTYMYD